MRLAMDEEMQGKPADAVWRKAIPFKWDRLQSRVLVWTVGVLTVGLMGLQLRRLREWGLYPGWFAEVWALSGGFAVLVWRLRSATGPAALLGGMICMNMMLAELMAPTREHTALPALVALFVLTFSATRFGRRRKEALGMAEPKRGRRAAQIAANLGVAGLCVARPSEAWLVACIAALAEATADTVSSEMGQVSGGPTWMITNLRRVTPGTDGGVSAAGTALGIAAAAMIAAVAALGGAISVQLALIAFGAGVGGLFFDSLLGATLERWGWVGNDWVNFASTLFAAAVALALSR